MNFYDRISGGEFDNPIPRPSRPVRPALLSKNVSDLSDREIEALATVKKKHEAAVAAYHVARDAYTAGYGDVNEKFRQEALNEVGLTNHEARHRAYAFAWEHGHSSGYSEVFSYLHDIAFIILGR